MTTLTVTKDQIREKIGKKWWLDDQQVLAAKLDYISGIDLFDQILEGKTLKEFDAVIHLEKYPKGLLFKIAKGLGFKTYPFPLENEAIQKITLTKTIKENKKTETETNTQKHGIPALLSFFIPGIGQLIKGHFLKAFVIWLSGVFIWFTFLGSLLNGQVGLSVMLYFVPFAVWFWNIYDAYNSNRKWSDRNDNSGGIAQLIIELKNGQKIFFGLKQTDIHEVKDFLKEIKLDYKDET